MDNEKDRFAIVLQAISFAARCHVGQLRKDGRTPYIAHPFRVMTVLQSVFRVDDPVLLATAALHDTIEDTTVDYDELAETFGEQVADNVALLTKDTRREYRERERAYYAALSDSPIGVQLCKLADTFDNLADSLSLAESNRVKQISQAKDLLEAFRDQLSEPWPHVLDAFERQISRIESSL